MNILGLSTGKVFQTLMNFHWIFHKSLYFVVVAVYILLYIDHYNGVVTYLPASAAPENSSGLSDLGNSFDAWLEMALGSDGPPC